MHEEFYIPYKHIKGHNKTFTEIWLYSSHPFLSRLAVYVAYLAVYIKPGKAARRAPATAYSEIHADGGARRIFYVLILSASQHFTSRFP